MPRKKREVKRELRKLGFIENRRGGKGSHSKWTHPLLPGLTILIAGHDGDDAKPYDEDGLAEAKRRLGELS